MKYDKEKAIQAVDDVKEEVIRLANYIYDNPEMGFHEYKASSALVTFLEDHGFQVEMGAAGLETAFRAERKGRGEGPKVGFLCEYDALPNGHSCGHNIIASSAVAGAVALADAMEEYSGSVVVLGTPAEEGSGGGKELLWRAGVMKDIDCAMMFHPGPSTVIRDKSLSIAAYKFTFHGKPAHAGACPEKGISAVEAVIQLFNNINGMRVTVKTDTRIHGIITKGGAVTNVIPDLTEAQFGIRASTLQELEELVERTKNCARAAALSTGCTVEAEEIGISYANLVKNETMLGLIEKNLEALGERIDVREAEVGVASTDAGNLSHYLPTIHVMISIDSPALPHTEQFAKACAGDRGALIALRAAKALAMTGVDLFEEPDLIERAKEELQERLQSE